MNSRLLKRISIMYLYVVFERRVFRARSARPSITSLEYRCVAHSCCCTLKNYEILNSRSNIYRARTYRARTQVHGLKLWLLVPPEYSIYSTLHPIEEMKDLILSRNLSSFCPHCRVVLQRSSQVVFVPEQWGHLVLNLAECLGMATEFSPVI